MAPFLLYGTRARSQTSQFSLEGRRATSSRSLLPCSLTPLILPRQSSFPIGLVAPEAVAVVEMGVVVGIGVVVVGVVVDVRIVVDE